MILSAAFAAIVAAVSCSSSVYRMNLQMRQPSESGYDFGGKEIGVVYVSMPEDTSNAKALAEGLANALDKDYYDAENRVGFYSMPFRSGADYASRDTMINLVMDTQKDVIFLMEYQKPQKVKDASSYRQPIVLHVYDSMGKSDTVRTFSGAVLLAEGSETSLRNTGSKASGKFLSKWEPETFYFYYFDSSSDWEKALSAADNFKWGTAMQIWTDMVPGLRDAKLAMAAHNLATAAYILGDLNLAERWLEIAEKGDPLGYSASLRAKINRK